jgi:hypothetical protein
MVVQISPVSGRRVLKAYSMGFNREVDDLSRIG